jgi:DNA-directed RNA polymerase specialized sigma24 family protein
MLTVEKAADLIAAIAAHQDRAAFSALFRHYAPRVKAFAMRGGADAEAAQEVAQETLIMVWCELRPQRGFGRDLDLHHRPQQAHRPDPPWHATADRARRLGERVCR